MAPGDWSTYLHGWLDAHEELNTIRGLERQGWRLFTDTPTAAFRQNEAEGGVADLSYSIGLTVTDGGGVRAVAWEGPAFRAGMRLGVRIVAVDGAPFSRDALLKAVRDAGRKPPILTVEQDGASNDRALRYQGTLRYPRLERIADAPDRLTALLAPR